MLVAPKEPIPIQSILATPMVICHKSRVRANEVDDMRIIGDVKGKKCSLT